MYWSYRVGTKAIKLVTQQAKEFTRAASILGIFVVGALTAKYGTTTTALTFQNGDSNIIIQEILDGVLPKVIPLTLLLFRLMKKKGWAPVKCICFLLVLNKQQRQKVCHI